MNLVLVRVRRGKRSVVPWLDVDLFQSCPCSAIACLTGVLGLIRACNAVCAVVASARSAARIVILVAGDVARRIDCIIVEAACAKKTRPGPLARRVSSTAGATDTTSSSKREIARQAVVTFS